jgi:hypothetical protein
MAFDSFQNDSATLKRYDVNYKGELTVAQSIAVSCDVQLHSRRSVDGNGEEFTTSAIVFITPTDTLEAVTIENLTKKTWRLDYQSVESPVGNIRRVRKPGKDKISHYELELK